MAKKPARSLAWLPEGTVEANAGVILPAMAREYFAAGRKLAAGKPDPADLHPFRLRTKRFRYTLEMFREIYGPALLRRLEELKPVQTALGEVNDCVATAKEFGGGKAFHRFLKKRGLQKTDEFLRCWRRDFDAPGNEERWVRYLTRGIRGAGPREGTPQSTEP